MKGVNVLFVLISAAAASAQTAPGFPLNVSTNLVVTFLDPNTSVTPPGVLLPRAKVLGAPAVLGPGNASQDSRYLVMMVDQDVTRNGAKTTLLHWFQPNLVPGSNSTLQVTTTIPSPAIGAPYLPPSPPAGSGPHSYSLVLFPQPGNFTVPASFVRINPPPDSSARVGFNITNFMAATGLSMPVAANYFRVSNGTATETSSALTVTGTKAATMTTGSGAATVTASGSAMATSSSGAEAVQLGGHGMDFMTSWVAGIVGAALWVI